MLPTLALDRVVDLALHAPDRRAETTSTCTLPGCGRPVTHLKPYCAEHVDRIPYVSRLAREIAARDREARAASRRRWQELDASGSRAREILGQLETRSRTVESLGRDLDVPPPSIASYVRALERAGLARRVAFAGRSGKLREVVTRIPRGPARSAG